MLLNDDGNLELFHGTDTNVPLTALQAVSSVIVLLRAQESSAWQDPALTRIFARTLAFTIDNRSKVRSIHLSILL